MLQLPYDPDLPFEPAPTPVPLPVDLALAQLVRNRYLNRSASRGLQGLSDGRPGMGERREKGRPYRLVFPG